MRCTRAAKPSAGSSSTERRNGTDAWRLSSRAGARRVSRDRRRDSNGCARAASTASSVGLAIATGGERRARGLAVVAIDGGRRRARRDSPRPRRSAPARRRASAAITPSATASATPPATPACAAPQVSARVLVAGDRRLVDEERERLHRQARLQHDDERRVTGARRRERGRPRGADRSLARPEHGVDVRGLGARCRRSSRRSRSRQRRQPFRP